jgi:hypothetical protein
VPIRGEEDMQLPGREEVEQQSMVEDKEPAEAGRLEEENAGMSEEEIDLNLVETFPASDPPSWTLGTDHLDESPDTND